MNILFTGTNRGKNAMPTGLAGWGAKVFAENMGTSGRITCLNRTENNWDSPHITNVTCADMTSIEALQESLKYITNDSRNKLDAVFCGSGVVLRGTKENVTDDEVSAAYNANVLTRYALLAALYSSNALAPGGQFFDFETYHCIAPYKEESTSWPYSFSKHQGAQVSFAFSALLEIDVRYLFNGSYETGASKSADYDDTKPHPSRFGRKLLNFWKAIKSGRKFNCIINQPPLGKGATGRFDTFAYIAPSELYSRLRMTKPDESEFGGLVGPDFDIRRVVFWPGPGKVTKSGPTEWSQ